MRGADKLVLVLGLVLPLLIAGLGWPAFTRWLGGGGPGTPEAAGTVATAGSRTPEAAGVVATATAPTAAAGGRSAARGEDQGTAAAGQSAPGPGQPTPGPAQPGSGAGQPAVVAAQPAPGSGESGLGAGDATPGAVRPEATRVSQGAQADTGPTAAVATFYELVQRHEFDTAAELWTPRMRAAYPPAENIDQRFARTQQVVVNRVEVVSARGDQAVVGVDLDERNPSGQRHYVGTWSVIRSGDGWLLDQPDLQAAP